MRVRPSPMLFRAPIGTSQSWGYRPWRTDQVATRLQPGLEAAVGRGVPQFVQNSSPPVKGFPQRPQNPGPVEEVGPAAEGAVMTAGAGDPALHAPGGGTDAYNWLRPRDRRSRVLL